MHRRRWVCSSDHNLSFTEKVAMRHHMEEQHAGTFNDLQLPVLLDMCERPADPNEKTDCPLCPTTLPVSIVQDHIALHLEELSLFVLPLNTDDTGAEGNSDKVEMIQSEPNRLEFDDLSSLGSFSDAGVDVEPRLQNPRAFASLLQNDKSTPEIGGQVKNWQMDEAIDEQKPVVEETPPEYFADTDWPITRQEKAECDKIFEAIDDVEVNYITAEQFTHYLAPVTEYAPSIWNLVNIHPDGILNKELFAVALYYMDENSQAIGDGKDYLIPKVLPPYMIPPGMRTQPRNILSRKRAKGDIFREVVYAKQREMRENEAAEQFQKQQIEASVCTFNVDTL
jgi:hypothetical protein